jgi:hypothetical protein
MSGSWTETAMVNFLDSCIKALPELYAHWGATFALTKSLNFLFSCTVISINYEMSWIEYF